jgi:serine/threonine protein kinase
MTPERWKQIEELYHSVLRLEARQWPAFLDQACTGDEALRREVESLLLYQVPAEGFIDAPALEVAARGMARNRTQSLVGRQVGPYKIQSLLGAGGMGEVYRAKDSRLGREVAVKVLPSAFSADAERVGRFNQEARAAGALNHPNILAIYDVGTHDGSPYLVSELLEGETLRDRLDGKTLSPRKALDYGLQVARGLAAAHERGIIHRDLKPENLFITKDDRIKILDFGLAKLTQAKLGSVAVTEGLTGAGLTEPGMLMGTVGYMSPEQVRGENVDHRSDIFSFGAIVYEMLSSRRAFHGNSAVETANAILNEEPQPLAQINGSTPLGLERIARHCLEKRPEQRFQSVSDLAFHLETLSGHPESTPAVLPGASKHRKHLGWVGAAILFLVAVTFVVAYIHRTRIEMRLFKLSALPPEKTIFGSHGSHAVSPDGRRLAFVATAGGRTSLWIRPLDSLAAVELAGTEQAAYPFWSPDGNFIGFFAGSKLKKMAISGEPPQTICDAGDGRGGAWSREGEIVFAPNIGDVLYHVSAAGGPPTPLTTFEQLHGENSHRWPYFLPDGKHFVFFVRSSKQEFQGFYVGLLGTKDKKLLLRGAGSVAYADPGYLLFVRDGTLIAQHFDAESLRVTGEPFSVAQPVGYAGNLWSEFSLSTNGILTYRRAGSTRNRLIWFSRQGKQLESVSVPDDYEPFRLSPNEKILAGSRLDPQTRQGDVWLFELSRGVLSRFTFDASYDYLPVWSPDGSRIVFATNRNGPLDLYMKALNGTGEDEALLKSDTRKLPTDWSPDGQFVLYESFDSKTSKNDLWVLPVGNRHPKPFLHAEFDERQGHFSPDGRWVAYCSDESGRYEVYVEGFPTPGGKRQISINGGTDPEWRRDGKELFYLRTDHELMAVEVKSGSAFESDVPKALFETQVLTAGVTFLSHYVVSSNGQRFLLAFQEETKSEPINIVVNWTAELPKN